MADAVVSIVLERIAAMVEEQIRNEVSLVRGVDEEVLKLSDDLTELKNVLDDAENRRFKDKNVNYWLFRLEQTSHEMEDVLDEWNYALLKYKIGRSNDVVAAPLKQKVCSFLPSSSCLWYKKVVVRRGIAKKIINVKQRLDQILKEKDQYNFIISQPATDPSPESWRVQSTSLIELGDVHGRDQDKDILVSKLIDNGEGEEELGNVQVVSIVGVGGLGKTTLAQMVYNDSRVKGCFELRIWVCVSDPFDLAAIGKGILESLEKGSSLNTNQLDVLFKLVQDSISGKRFLLVLDDVWTEDYNKWEPLEKTLRSCGGVGSKILVTTRKERVAEIMGTMHDDIHHPGLLSDEDCWLILRHMALYGKNNEVVENFEDVGKKIAQKCKGLPLAAKVLGSLLCSKKTLEKWKNVLNSEIWEMEEVEVEIFPHLLLSYIELSPSLKRCFSYCAVFPKDRRIDVDELIRSWMALGYLGSKGDMEGKGRDYFDILVMHSLFQDFEKDYLDEKIIYCKMHDIVHDFAQFLRKSGRIEGTTMNKTTCSACDPELVSNVNEFCSLFREYEGSSLNICDCLARVRVLSLQLCGLQGIPSGMENLIHLRSLNLSENALSQEDLKIISQLYNMQTLSLSSCGLVEISKEIGNLIHLRHLDLSRNENLEELPRQIGNLIQLRHLDLSRNTFLKELPREIGNLIHLRTLDLNRNENLKELPREIGNLTQLRHIDMSRNENLKELPKEIGNLIHLRHLCLSENESLKELPREIGNLIELRHLDLSRNESLKELPESTCALINLQTLDNSGCYNLSRLPEGLGQLTSLRTLPWFSVGSGGNKLGSLKKLNNLSGSLLLRIRLGDEIDCEEMVKDAKEAQLRNKIAIQRLDIYFDDVMGDDEESSLWRMKVLDALEPHLKLKFLLIEGYKGYQLGVEWLASPHNQLTKLVLSDHTHLASLPPLGKLPCLEDLSISLMNGLRIVGRELMGIGRRSGEDEMDHLHIIAFPKLKYLTFWYCSSWKEWEDITSEEEEECGNMTLMPCLTDLAIRDCTALAALPHRLLRKASSLQVLNITDSTLLEDRYRDEDGSDWKSISQYKPRLQLQLRPSS